MPISRLARRFATVTAAVAMSVFFMSAGYAGAATVDADVAAKVGSNVSAKACCAVKGGAGENPDASAKPSGGIKVGAGANVSGVKVGVGVKAPVKVGVNVKAPVKVGIGANVGGGIKVGLGVKVKLPVKIGVGIGGAVDASIGAGRSAAKAAVQGDAKAGVRLSAADVKARVAAKVNADVKVNAGVKLDRVGACVSAPNIGASASANAGIKTGNGGLLGVLSIKPSIKGLNACAGIG